MLNTLNIYRIALI